MSNPVKQIPDWAIEEKEPPKKKPKQAIPDWGEPIIEQTGKKKVSAIDFGGSSLEAGNTLSSESQSNGEIPTIEMYTTPSGEMVEANPFSLSKKFNELSNKTKEVEGLGDRGAMKVVPDEEAKSSAKKLQEDFKDLDLTGIYEETKDIPDELLAQYKDDLAKTRTENYPAYQRKLSRLKWQPEIDKSINQYIDSGFLDEHEAENIKKSIHDSINNSEVGTFEQQRENANSVANAIKLFGGENSEKILNDYATEISKVYGNSYKSGGVKVEENSPEGKYLSPNAQLGYQYIKDLSTEQAKQYDRLLIDPKTIKDPNQLRGYNSYMMRLEETGISLQKNAVQEDLNNLQNIQNKNGGLSEEQLAQAKVLEDKQRELVSQENELDAKYPDRITDKVDDALQEILGQRANFGGRFMGKVTQGVGHTVDGIWNFVSQPFMSDASNNLTELGIMGQTIKEEKDTHLTDKNKSLQDSELIIQPDLKAKIDAIKGDNNLSSQQKESIISGYLKNNMDKWGRVPIKGGRFNPSPSAILNSVSDITASLVPFIAVEAATGGVGGAGAAAKFFRTANAAFTTGFYDHMADGIHQGKTGSELYKYGVVTTLIDAMAMGGAGTPSEVRALAGNKTSAAKMLATLTDKEIEQQLAKGLPKSLKLFGKDVKPFIQSAKDRLAATPKMFAEGLKTGTKFEGAMTAANELKHQVYDTEIDRDLNFKHSVLGGLSFGILGAGLGHLGHKAPNELQRDFLIKLGENPESFHEVNNQMKRDGEITTPEFEHRKSLIDKSEQAFKIVPEVNSKGQPLTEKQRGDYMYQTVIKNEANKGKSDLPPKQAAQAEKTALVADHTRGLILEPPTEKQLNDRIGVLERKLEPKKDAEGKAIELPEKEKLDMQAELEALKNEAENRKKEVVDTKLSEPVEGEKPNILVQVKLDGKEINAKYLDEHKGQKIVEIDGDVYTYDPKNEVLFKVALDDSKTTGNRTVNPEANNVKSAKEYIDWSTKTREENTEPTTIEVKEAKPTDVVGSEKTDADIEKKIKSGEYVDTNELVDYYNRKLPNKKVALEDEDGSIILVTENGNIDISNKYGNAKDKALKIGYENEGDGVVFIKQNESGKDVEGSKPKTQTINEQPKEVTQDTNPTTVKGKEQPLATDIAPEGESGKKEPPKEPTEPVGEGKGSEDWTHINKKDITDAEDLANKHPFGESESWKNSVKKGLEKLAKIAKKGESLYDAAKNKVNEWAAKVKQEVLDDGKSTFNPSDEEIAQMAYHRTMTNKRIAELEPDLTSPIQAVRDAAEIVLSDLEAQKEMVDYVLHNTATTAGRAFNIRQMVSKIDSENGLQVKRMDIIRKQKGQPLSEKQEQEIRDIHDEEVKNQKAKDEYEQKKAEKDFEEAVKAEVDRRLKSKKTTKSKDEVKVTAKKAGDVIRKLKMPKGGTRLDITLGGWDKLVEGVAKLVETGVTIKEAVHRMINDGSIAFKSDKDRDYAIDYMDNANKHNALDNIREISEKEKSEMLTKSAVGKGLVNDLVNHYIDKGLRGKELFTEMNKDLKDVFPEITEQQVRDAYLKEGEFTLDKKENINKAQTDAKNELRSIAKVETDIVDLKDEREMRKREREERQKTDYENKLLAEKRGLIDKKALTEKQEKRLVELNKELDRIKQRKEKDAKVSNPKDLNRSDKEKAVLDEIKKEKEQWAKEKQAQRDLDAAAKKAQTIAKNEAERLKALTEKLGRLEKGQRDAPKTSTPKVENPAIEQVKSDIKDADKKLREAESESNRLNKEIQAKKDKLAEVEANIKRAEKGLESIKTNRKKSDKQIDKDISEAETRLKKELNKQGVKLDKGSKAEKEQKQKVADSHNERTDKLIESIDTKLQDATLSASEKAALENAKKILEKSKVNPDSKLDIFDAVDKAEKNTELARAELANSEKLADIKHEISRSQIQMGKDKLQTEQDILLKRHKDNLQKKIDENQRRIDAGEFVEKEPARLKTSDAESVRLEIKDRETKNKLNAIGKKAQREAMTKREKVIDTLQSLYVIGLVGRLSTLAKVGVSAITKQPLNTITSQTFGRLGGVLFPKIENALRGEGNEGWRKEKNRYMAHYGALGAKGMAKLIQKGKENAQKADENYINAKDKLDDLRNQFGEDSKQYKDFVNGEFKKAENAQKQALLDNVTNSLYEWIGGNAWEDAAEVFLHSSAKLEQLLGKGEREMWNDKTRKEKIMFVLSTSAATHGVLKNFSARAEFAANFVARLENKMKQGIDISSAEEILKTVNESYIAFQRGKYQEDNAITGGFKAGLDGLRIWAEKHPDYKYAADLMAGALKFKNPIVRTPLNIAREAIVEYTIGVPLAIAKYRNSLKDAKVDAKQFDLAGQEMKDHMKKFMDNIPSDKADFIYRAFRKGGFGLGVMALTAMGGIKFGGFFNRDEKRRKKGDDLGVNEVEIGGQKLSHLEAKIFEHTSAFFPALLWSNYDRVRDENLKAGSGELGANLDAVVKDFQGMMDQIPIGNEVQNPLSGIQIPLIGPFLTEYAEATDVDESGEKIKRKPKGNPLEKVWQNIEMKIPGLRQNVPKSGERTKAYTDEQKNNPILKSFIDKGISIPDYNPEKINTKEVNGKTVEKLSDYDEETQKLYIDTHKKNYEQGLKDLKDGNSIVYKDEDGGVHLNPEFDDIKTGWEQVQFDNLTDDQIKYLEGQITTKATKETKAEIDLPNRKKKQ